MTAPTAHIATRDAVAFLGADTCDEPAVFTSLPDAAETGMDIPTWRDWFVSAAYLTCRQVTPGGVAVFYQTDRRVDGGVLSKAHLVMEAADMAGMRLVWHKIAVAGMGTSLFRPSYTHVVAVSAKAKAGRPTPDLFMKGSKLYRDATDGAALDVGLDLIEATGAQHVLDPFCGRGSIAAAAARRGMDSTSIDIDPAQTEQAAINVAAAGAEVTFA